MTHHGSDLGDAEAAIQTLIWSGASSETDGKGGGGTSGREGRSRNITANQVPGYTDEAQQVRQRNVQRMEGFVRAP